MANVKANSNDEEGQGENEGPKETKEIESIKTEGGKNEIQSFAVNEIK